MRYRLQRHDGTDCSATMVPITVLRMVPIQRYRQRSLSSCSMRAFWLEVSDMVFCSFLTLQRYENQTVLPHFQTIKNDLEHYFFLGSHRLHR